MNRIDEIRKRCETCIYSEYYRERRLTRSREYTKIMRHWTKWSIPTSRHEGYYVDICFPTLKLFPAKQSRIEELEKEKFKMKSWKEQCPNCHIDLETTKFSDLENGNICVDVWIEYCPECHYIGDCRAE